MSNDDIQLLQQIWEFFDGIADGAPDASYAAKMANTFSEPLRDLINRSEDPVQTALAAAHNSGSDRQWDETVQRLRDEGLLPNA